MRSVKRGFWPRYVDFESLRIDVYHDVRRWVSRAVPGKAGRYPTNTDVDIVNALTDAGVLKPVRLRRSTETHHIYRIYLPKRTKFLELAKAVRAAKAISDSERQQESAGGRPAFSPIFRIASSNHPALLSTDVIGVTIPAFCAPSASKAK